MPAVVIRRVDPTSPDVAALLEELDAYQRTLYPPESLHLLPPEALAEPSCTVLGAYVDGALAGCGAIVDHAGEYGELKRMYVRPEARGLGVGRRLLVELEARAWAAGLPMIRLETGVSQHEALALYERSRYRRRGPYGSYPSDPLSVYMEKRLGGA